MEHFEKNTQKKFEAIERVPFNLSKDLTKAEIILPDLGKISLHELTEHPSETALHYSGLSADNKLVIFTLVQHPTLDELVVNEVIIDGNCEYSRPTYH